MRCCAGRSGAVRGVAVLCGAGTLKIFAVLCGVVCSLLFVYCIFFCIIYNLDFLYRGFLGMSLVLFRIPRPF
jgi:hypothetical protein